MNKKIFSLPFSPYLTLQEYEYKYLPFVLAHKEFIYDIFTTIRIPPFLNDAMGGNFDNDGLIFKAFKIQNDTGIPVSATFNDTSVTPSKENMMLFIKNFRPLYEQGIRSVTIPFFHWLLTGEIQKNFPLLKIKNSVLNEVDNAQSYWLGAQAGYKVMNIDRNVLRNKHTLKEIKKAQVTYEKRFGDAPKSQILVNEQCSPHCPVRNEHYSINFQGEHYFGNELSNYTCNSWKRKDPAYDFKRAVGSPFREDIDELLTYIDIFKLFGRDGKTMLQGSLSLIESFARNDEILPTFANATQIKDYEADEFKQWRSTIKNCNFQCWNCMVCENLSKKVNLGIVK